MTEQCPSCGTEGDHEQIPGYWSINVASAIVALFPGVVSDD